MPMSAALGLRQRLKRVRASVGVLSPRHRRWQRFLRELPLDPDTLPRPLAAPGVRDFIICGSPRSGTTLAAAMLYQPPRVVTVMEPWDGMRLAPAALFGSLRDEIAQTGQLSRGKLDINALGTGGSVQWWREGEHAHEVSTTPGYLLGVKWPGYWRFLELLPDTKFVLCLRHPLAAIGSYKQAGGRLTRGLNYDTPFNRAMNQYLLAETRDAVLRRVLLFDYVHSRILPYLARRNVFVLRYERWFTEREPLLAELSAFLGVELGPGYPVLHPPRSTSALTPGEVALVRRHCATAAALGYDLTSAGRGG